MTIPLQFASFYDRQEIFMWSNCLLDLGTDLNLALTLRPRVYLPLALTLYAQPSLNPDTYSLYSPLALTL